MKLFFGLPLDQLIWRVLICRPPPPPPPPFFFFSFFFSFFSSSVCWCFVCFLLFQFHIIENMGASTAMTTCMCACAFEPRVYVCEACTVFRFLLFFFYHPFLTPSSWGKRSFQHIGPVIWNSLPLSVRQSSSLSPSMSKLTTHLFSSTY